MDESFSGFQLARKSIVASVCLPTMSVPINATPRQAHKLLRYTRQHVGYKDTKNIQLDQI